MQVDWKSAGCPLFDKPPAPAIPTDLHAALASSLVGSVLGAEGLERLAAAKRQPLPQQQPHAPGVCVRVRVHARVRACVCARACMQLREALGAHLCAWEGKGRRGRGAGLVYAFKGVPNQCVFLYAYSRVCACACTHVHTHARGCVS